MNTTGSKHWYLEFHIDWWTTPCLGSNSRHEFYFSINVAFCLSGETLDAPHNGLLFGFILGATKECLNLGLGSILGNGNLNDNVSGKELIGKVGNHFEIDGDPEEKKLRRRK